MRMGNMSEQEKIWEYIETNLSEEQQRFIDIFNKANYQSSYQWGMKVRWDKVQLDCPILIADIRGLRFILWMN